MSYILYYASLSYRKYHRLRISVDHGRCENITVYVFNIRYIHQHVTAYLLRKERANCNLIYMVSTVITEMHEGTLKCFLSSLLIHFLIGDIVEESNRGLEGLDFVLQTYQ
jgi:hypothetical protein